MLQSKNKRKIVNGRMDSILPRNSGEGLIETVDSGKRPEDREGVRQKEGGG